VNYVARQDRSAGIGSTSVSSDAPKIVNLALQGGGSHGAFTWGVLDRLLEEERLTFAGITASSAGAINAVVLADGLAAGGREGGKAALNRFWRKASDAARVGIFQQSLFDKASATFGLDYSPGYLFMEGLSYYVSPYQFNPFNFNPLKYLLAENVDFARVRKQQKLKLFISATNVETAKVEIFLGEKLEVEHVLASTCLPLLMHAVQIGERYYWDGGFSGNPAVFPLILECDAPDIVLVHITPSERPGIPKTSQSIMNRMQEINLNASHMREMRSLAYITKLVDEGKAQSKRIFVHAIEGEDITRNLSASSRVNNDWDFLLHLREVGRRRADEWLTVNFDRIGIESTIDIQSKYT
jgi:NTE family protein